LLETMNSASEDVNKHESELREAQEVHRRSYLQFQRRRETLHSEQSQIIDRVQPYIAALHARDVASSSSHTAISNYVTASAEHSKAKAELSEVEASLDFGKLQTLESFLSMDEPEMPSCPLGQAMLCQEQQERVSQATDRVRRWQEERDSCERKYVQALKVFKEAEDVVLMWQAWVGDAAMHRAGPYIKEIMLYEQNLAQQEARIKELDKCLHAAKSSYNGAVAELGHISNAVHKARAAHKARESLSRLSVLQTQSNLVLPEVPTPLDAPPEAIEDFDDVQTSRSSSVDLCTDTSADTSTGTGIVEDHEEGLIAADTDSSFTRWQIDAD